MTNDVGPMIRQWTMGSAITQLRSFVSGVHVELDEVRRFIVRPGDVDQYAAARAARLLKRAPPAGVSNSQSAAGTNSCSAPVQPAAPTSPSSSMEIDQIEDSTDSTEVSYPLFIINQFKNQSIY